MTVKDKVGRTRYVAFRIVSVGDAERSGPAGRDRIRLLDGPLPRPALAGALPLGAKLTRFDGTHGVLRTDHRDRDALLAVLKAPLRVGGKEVRVETLVTSGTLRKAALALPARMRERRRGPDAA